MTNIIVIQTPATTMSPETSPASVVLVQESGHTGITQENSAQFSIIIPSGPPGPSVTWTTISGKPAVIAEGATQAAARASIGAGTGSSNFSGSYPDLANIPATFPPSAHSHIIGDITGLQAALDGKAASLGADDNYVTDAEKVKLANLSNVNSGDQDLSGLIPKSVVDVKGDLIVATAADTVGRLAATTNGYVLTLDSAETTGMKWAASSGGSDPWTYVIATQDTSEGLAVETNISGLSVSNLSDGLYEFSAMVFATSPATGTGAQAGMVAPAGCTVKMWAYHCNAAPTAGGGILSSPAATVNGSVSMAKSLNAASNSAQFVAAEMRGVIRAASMSGSLTMTIKSESSGTTVVAKADSFITYRRIGN